MKLVSGAWSFVVCSCGLVMWSCTARSGNISNVSVFILVSKRSSHFGPSGRIASNTNNIFFFSVGLQSVLSDIFFSCEQLPWRGLGEWCRFYFLVGTSWAWLVVTMRQSCQGFEIFFARRPAFGQNLLRPNQYARSQLGTPKSLLSRFPSVPRQCPVPSMPRVNALRLILRASMARRLLCRPGACLESWGKGKWGTWRPPIRCQACTAYGTARSEIRWRLSGKPRLRRRKRRIARRRMSRELRRGRCDGSRLYKYSESFAFGGQMTWNWYV